MKWTTRPITKRRSIRAFDLGLPGAVLHDLQCWVCEKEPAVYDMNPNWVFRPCWKCQGKGIGAPPKKRRWWEVWK